MRWLIGLVLALAVVLSPAIAGAADGGDSWIGNLTGENTGNGVVAGGSVHQQTGGQKGDDSNHQGSGGPNAGIGPVSGGQRPARPDLDGSGVGDWTCFDGDLSSQGGNCVEQEAEEEPEPEEPEAPPAVVTITDIASFVPAPPSVATEPDGIGAKNMPLNTIATSSTQTIGGELFGFPVSVTFTPAGFRHDWGDGTVTESGHGGATWESLGQAEFSPTDTSHAYAEKGTYTLTVTALYTAVVDFGGWGTRSVDGVISAPGAARDIRIVEVHTALVRHDCNEDPTGAGCS